MLLQTNSYIVPKDKRAEHARLMRRFRQVLAKLGCDMFEVYEQVGTNWGSGESNGRYVQIMRFRDRKHQVAVQSAERNDPNAQQLIAEFCELVNFPYQQQQGFFAVGFYTSVLPVAPARVRGGGEGSPGGEDEPAPSDETAHASADEAVSPPPPPPPPVADEAAMPMAEHGDDAGTASPSPDIFAAAAAEPHPHAGDEGAHPPADPGALAVAEHTAAAHPADAPASVDDDLSDLHFGQMDPEPDEIAAAGPPLEVTERVEVTRRRDSHEDELLSEEELLKELGGDPIDHSREHTDDDHHHHTDDNGEPAAFRHPPRGG